MIADLRQARRQPAKFPGFIAVALFALAAASTGSAAVASAEPPRLELSLPDQFDLDHTAAAYAGKVVLLTVTDREGSAFSGAWIKAIFAALPPEARSQVHIVSAANLHGVPFFVRGLVKSKFPQDPQAWVLLDWHGQLAKTYALTPQCCNLLLFAPDGRLVQKIAGRDVRPAEASAVARAIESLTAPTNP